MSLLSSTLGMDPLLLGKWKYEDCTIKNTSMEGTVTFYQDGSFALQARGHDDCPVPPLSGRYHYQAERGVFSTDYKRGYGISRYYLVTQEGLYFSNQKISKVKESFSNGYLRANWQYKLIRVPD